MARAYTADMSVVVRVLALVVLVLATASPASAAAPRFGVYDLGDLAKPSHNVYGDVRVSTDRGALVRDAPGATVVRCAAGCRLGAGWLAFAKGPSLTAGDVRSARAQLGRRGWTVSVSLTAHGQARWQRIAGAAKRYAVRTGLPPVYAIVVEGSILAAPFANELHAGKGTLMLTGFTQAGARRAAKTLG
jgi:hypothetical protein